jgi:GTP:adenosylcobinamide-phosphate guanylyltransferase
VEIIAVVLAGGGRDAVCDDFPLAINKAFVPIAGRTLVERTLDALRSTSRIARIIVVAPSEARHDPALAGIDEFRESGATIQASLRSGLEGLPADLSALIVTSDLPVLTASAVDEFIDIAITRDPDIAYGCLAKADHMARFPQIPHTWAYLRESAFCGTGLIAIKPRILPSLERFLDALAAGRKNPLQLASIFGWSTLARYAARRLTLADVEARASFLLGAPAVAVRCTHPEVAVNVDRQSDIALAEALVAAARPAEPAGA